MEHRRATILAFVFFLASSLSAQTLDEARALHSAGKLREAVVAYRAVAAANAAADPQMSATARNNACAVLNELGDFRAALAECQVALRLRRQQQDPFRLARTLNNTGLSLHYLGEYQEAEAHFREALEMNRIAGDPEGQVINFSNLGLVATSQGRYNRALDLHGMAATLAGRHPDEPWAAAQVRISRINQGVILEKLGAYREALDIYKEVLEEEAELDPLRRAMLRVNIGVVYRNLGDPVSAQAAFRDAIALYQAEGDQAGLSNAWLNLGLVHHLNLRQPRHAEDAFRNALRFAGATGDRSEEIQDLFYLGRLLLEQGRTDEAGAVFTRSLEAAGKSGSAEGRWSALEGLGRVAAARGQDAPGVQLLDQAMNEIEKVRSSLRRSTLRSHFFGERRPVYALAVELLARMEAREPGAGHAEKALEIVQRAKIRELLDTLGSPGNAAAPLRAGALRAKIGNGLLLEYFLGEKDLFLWVVREDGIRMANLGPYEPILADAVAVHEALSRRQAPDPARLSRLSRLLLGPIEGIEADEVRIAPDGALRYLPFELLGDPLLLDGAPVSYLPSGSALGWLRSLDLTTPVFTLAGFGSPELPKGSAAGDLAARYHLPPLPGAERELQTISKLLPGQHSLYTGPNAGEENLRRTLANGARIVHFATHAVIDERPGRGAAILLAPGPSDDGLLHPEEIVNLQYRADLTVLAGCRTALSPGSQEGDALASLTGAFLASGSPGVLATLWEVGDDATAAFMEQLYHELGKGRRPAEALRLTKQRFRQDPRWNRPELWAGYVLVGEVPRVAYTHRTRYVIGALLLAAIALTPVFLDWRQRLPRGAASGTSGPPAR
ncbi:MAG TPA: CHAT domain-containing tetratricopeptide repeat protein [Thermoanaerobaculia bacterium]|nr:CHAT domain-containing tetratricopeptide repeat protein [Thermoanaerobaculia bacterium]